MIKKPVNGMRDILPKEMEARDFLIGLIKETYKAFGFTSMETPCVESIENLTGKQGGENEKLTFKIMKRGEKLNIEEAKSENDLADSGLRYDLTMPLSRYYANHMAELPKPFKALQIGPVWRAERPQKGRFRQFYQCDIDILGDPSNMAETELILATTTLLDKIGFKNVQILINDRRILKSMAAYLGLSEDKYDEIFIILDKLDKIGAEGVSKELSELGMTQEGIDRYLKLFEVSAGKKGIEGLNALGTVLGDHLETDVTDNMREIFSVVTKASDVDFELVFDPTLVRGMGYYTGPIFEIRVPQFNSSVGGGGRYDEMVGKFANQSTPACGFSIGFERIITILMEENYELPTKKKKIALLMEKGMSDEKKAAVLKEAALLRKNSVQVLVAVMQKNKKFQKEQLSLEGYEEIKEYYERPLE